MNFDESDGSVILREIARLFIDETNKSNNVVERYDYGIERIASIEADPYSRVDFTKDYVIRIFEQQKRKYQETVERDLLSKNEETEAIE